jgi:hypothetical protein
MRGTHVNLSTRCVRYRLVASLLTSCNNVNIFSSCYKVVTHNLLNYRRITSCWNSKSHLLISSWYYVLQTKTWTKLTLCSIRDNSVCVTPSHFSPTTADRTGDDCLYRKLHITEIDPQSQRRKASCISYACIHRSANVPSNFHIRVKNALPRPQAL